MIAYIQSEKDPIANLSTIGQLAQNVERDTINVKRHYERIAKGVIQMSKPVKVEMKSRFTGTPAEAPTYQQEQEGKNRQTNPELYGMSNVKNDGVRKGTLSADDIIAIRAKTQSSFQHDDLQKPLTLEDLKPYDLTAEVAQELVNRAAKIREIKPQDNKIRSELQENFTGRGSKMRLNSEQKVERALQMIDRIDERVKSDIAKQDVGKPPNPAAIETAPNLDALVKAVMHEPNYAQSVIETKLSNPEARDALIEFANKLSESIRLEPGLTQQSQQLSHFFSDHVAERVTKVVIDELHQLQSTKDEPTQKCQNFLNKLDVNVLRDVCKALKEDKSPKLKDNIDQGRKWLRSKVSLHDLAKRSYQAKNAILKAEQSREVPSIK